MKYLLVIINYQWKSRQAKIGPGTRATCLTDQTLLFARVTNWPVSGQNYLGRDKEIGTQRINKPFSDH